VAFGYIGGTSDAHPWRTRFSPASSCLRRHFLSSAAALYRSPSYLARISLNVGGGTGGHACAGGGGGDTGRGGGGGVAGRGGGADGLDGGTGLDGVDNIEGIADVGTSACLPARSSRICFRSFMCACPMYRSNSSALAWRRLENMET
jgi:hypothetical protein